MGRILFVLIISAAVSGCNQGAEQHEGPLTIAFGSCSHEEDSLQMWSEILAQNPDLLILTGDNIYGDTHDMQVMKAKYDKQKSNPSFYKLTSQVPTIGIWDDHDYGVNDGGRNYSKKDESKELMLKFLEVPADNPVWKHKGAYNVYSYHNNKLKIILLDTRYFRDTLQADTVGPAKYISNKNGDILGEAQWSWLEDQLIGSEADIHLIISSIQLIPQEHNYEKWSNFPVARQRFIDLLSKTKPNQTVLISGDRHIAELSRLEVPGLDYPLYEITSSGLTHTWSSPWTEPNSHRIDSLIIKKNYGLLHIDWKATSPALSVEIKGHNDSTFLKHQL